MALSDKYKKNRERVAGERERLAIERAQGSIQRLMETEQFKLSALSLPDAKMAIDTIVGVSVKTALDPVGQLLDTLRAKGFRPAEIRKMVHRLYLCNLQPLNAPEDEHPAYDEMLSAVAYYVSEHQEIYNTLDPEILRSEDIT